MQSGVYIAGAGVYLLTIGPASATQGLAEVSGVSTGVAPCNSKYKADGVQFRLVQLDLTLAELGDVNHLRNLVAYKCFGVADWAADVTDPFGTHSGGHGLIDQLRAAQTITGCEVPLAVLYWTATDGVVFVDVWSVRRALVSKDLLDTWAPGAGRRRFVEGLATFLQFQQQLNDLAGSAPAINPLSVKVTDYFRYLPASGLLPIGNVTGGGFDYLQFLSGRTYRNPVFMDGTRVERLIHTSFLYPAIDLSNQEMLWLYQVRENQQSFDSGANQPQLYMVFANGHIPFQGEAQYDLSYWNYANFV